MECYFTVLRRMQLCKYPFSEDLCKAKNLWKISYCLLYPVNVHFHTLAILGHQISAVKSLIWWGGNVSDDSSFRDAFKNSRRIARFSYSCPNMTPNFSPLGNGNGICCDGRGGLLWTECLYSPQNWNPNPQFDDLRRWGLREVTRSWRGGVLVTGTTAPIRDPREFSCPFRREHS